VRGGYPDPRLFGLPGAEQLRAIIDGRAPRPPISHLTGMLPVEVDSGHSVFTMPATGWLYSPQGIILGGVHAVLADGPFGCALQASLPAGTPYTTADLSMTFLRPAGVYSDTLTARGRLIHMGRRVGLTEALVEDARGRLIAHGTSRLAILPTVDPLPQPPSGAWPSFPSPPSDPPDPYLRPWPRTLLSGDAWRRMTGLQLMQAFVADELPLPPIHHLTGLRPVAAEEGSSTFVLPATHWLCSPLGRVEGGFVAMLADSAIGAAVQTTLPPAIAYASVDLKVTYHRPAFPDGRDLVARAEVTHRGASLASAMTVVRNAEGKPVASAVGSVLILPGRGVSLDQPAVPDEELAPSGELG
jgi:uncharacterized protein (TIGR00369 family)